MTTTDLTISGRLAAIRRPLAGAVLFACLCGATLPARLIKRLEAAGDHPEVVEALGIEWALGQIRDLLAHGAPGYHLYIMNRAKSALALAAGLAA